MANFLSASALLVPYNAYIYYLNPQMAVSYKKSFISIEKKWPIILVTYSFACPYRNYGMVHSILLVELMSPL
ncbi:hypothetical protein ACWO4B_000039 [Clostridium sporogenes]